MPIHTKKSLGQNWLVNPRILDKIVSVAEITKDNVILEVGPGTGLLTKKLAEKAGKVIAVEKDRRLVPALQETLKNYPNIEIIEADILKFNYTRYQIQDTRYKIVANIPYYITSNFLRKIFEEFPKPKLIVLTIQKEVAQRIMAKPPRMNLLALSVQYYSEPEIVSYIPKNNFRPVPKVDSSIIRLMPKSPEVELQYTQKLFNLIRSGFSEKRKQLAPILAKKLKISREKVFNIFQKEGIAPQARAENLSLKQWQRLLSNLFN